MEISYHKGLPNATVQMKDGDTLSVATKLNGVDVIMTLRCGIHLLTINQYAGENGSTATVYAHGIYVKGK